MVKSVVCSVCQQVSLDQVMNNNKHTDNIVMKNIHYNNKYDHKGNDIFDDNRNDQICKQQTQ